MRRTLKVRAGLAGSAVALAAVASGCVYNTPPVGAASGFNDVATVSKNDAWAVGGTATSFTSASRALVEHFDGRSWRLVAIPSTSGTTLTSITAVSASDVGLSGAARHCTGTVMPGARRPIPLVCGCSRLRPGAAAW